jgi:glucose-6-phosphate dehydrogenase assembly protein OpcA
MAPDVGSVERLEDHAVSIDPSEIEAEFTRIWQETAAAGTDESSIRLRVLNFVGIGIGADAEARFEAVMAALPERNPCRGILAVTSLKDDTVAASIAAHCWRTASGGRQFCCEEVILRAGPGHEHALASAVLGLLVPEVMVVAWLIGPPYLEAPLPAEIMEAADRVVVDSAAGTGPASGLSAVLRAARDGQVAVSDLAWCRLAAWRTLIAQLFDGEDALGELARLQSIEISAAGGGASADALLLAGWLVSRLDLSVADISGRFGALEATLYDGVNAVRLWIAPDESLVSGLRDVRIRTAGASFQVELHRDSGHMHVREEWPETPTRRAVACQDVSDAALIAETLDGDDDPAVFFDAVSAALALLEADVTGTP